MYTPPIRSVSPEIAWDDLRYLIQRRLLDAPENGWRYELAIRRARRDFLIAMADDPKEEIP